jgi:hypothetical protein
VLKLKFGRHVSSHRHLVKGIITAPSFKSPTWVLYRAELILCWMPMCPHFVYFWCMGQSVNSVHSLLWVLGFQTTKTLNSFDWLLLHSATTSISILQYTLLEVCHPLLIHQFQNTPSSITLQWFSSYCQIQKQSSGVNACEPAFLFWAIYYSYQTIWANTSRSLQI